MIREETYKGAVVEFPKSFGKHYLYIRTVARTQTGIVAEATNTRTKIICACKFILRSELNNSNTLRHFELESRVQPFLNHNNVVKYYETLYFEKYIVLVNEFCQNGDLLTFLLHSQTLNLRLAYNMIYNILEGIAYLHAHKIAHRDMKPENIYLDSKLTPKIGDYGCCEILQKTVGGTFDSNSDTMGTLYYAPPEIFKYGNIDPFKSDIWSFGIICFVLITKNMPWKPGTDEEVMTEISSKGFTATSPMPIMLMEMIKRCTDMDPMKRPSAQELLNHEVFDTIKKKKVMTGIVNSYGGQRHVPKMDLEYDKKRLVQKPSGKRRKTNTIICASFGNLENF